jgi:hypothetical protein
MAKKVKNFNQLFWPELLSSDKPENLQELFMKAEQ